ncbi:MAG: hypothetical protein PHO69_11920 [Petrimonas sp.]|nr:hypothetical protein [Petrimonas sp.]
MEIRRSELQQEMFVILDSKVSIDIPQDAKGQDADDLDVDLTILTNKEDDHLVRILYVVKAKRTHTDKPGIDIEVYASGDFRIDVSIEADSPQFQQLVNYSATAITYNNIRAYLQNITSYYPLDMYVLPAIDLNDLCKKYYESIKEETKE